jgi:two-component system, chemotaxis family, protein-glutamate methylesterase/glutaminase
VANRNLVVIGASAGGIEALQLLLSGLPPDLNAAVLIVVHTSSHSGSLLPRILERAGRLPVIHPEDGTPIQRGHVYVAPPNFQMIVERDLIRVIQGPRENLHRPAIDPLFRSAAASYGRRVIGVVLTGLLDDGTSGLMVVHAHGGEAIVQDPATAMFASMPASALEQVPSACVLPLPEIAGQLVEMIQEELPVRETKERPDPETAREIKVAELDMSELDRDEHPGRPSTFACPDCGGVLWEIEDNGFLRFRCRVGHAFTARHLNAQQRQAIEAALWAALRALEESASLYRRMAERAENFDHSQTAGTFRERAANTTANAETLRNFLLRVNNVEEEVPLASKEA